MKSTSFCLNYASSVSFLNLFPREAIAWFCVTASESHHCHLCSPKSLTLIHTSSWVSSWKLCTRKEEGFFHYSTSQYQGTSFNWGVRQKKKMWKEPALWQKESSHCYVLVRHQMSTSPVHTFLYAAVGNKPLFLRPLTSVSSAKASHDFSICRAAVHNLQPLLQ